MSKTRVAIASAHAPARMWGGALARASDWQLVPRGAAFPTTGLGRGGHHLAARRGRDGQLSSSRADHGGWSIGTDEGRRLPSTQGSAHRPRDAPDRMESARAASGSGSDSYSSRSMRRTGAGDRIDATPRARQSQSEDWTFSSRQSRWGHHGAVASLPREIEDAVIVNVDNLTQPGPETACSLPPGVAGGGDDCHP